jgi:hypothetical protein
MPRSTRGPWSFDLDPEATRPSAGVVDDPAKAFNGRGVLEIGMSNSCAVNRAITRARFPEASGESGGPAVQFAYRTRNADGFYLGVSPVTERAGAPSRLKFEMSSGLDGGCRDDPTLWIDDLVLTTDSSCPTR